MKLCCDAFFDMSLSKNSYSSFYSQRVYSDLMKYGWMKKLARALQSIRRVCVGVIRKGFFYNFSLCLSKKARKFLVGFFISYMFCLDIHKEELQLILILVEIDHHKLDYIHRRQKKERYTQAQEPLLINCVYVQVIDLFH